jgi:hypothetical protein
LMSVTVSEIAVCLQIRRIQGCLERGDISVQVNYLWV